MTPRVAALREQLRAAKHAQYRQILPDGWSTAGAPCSLCERKALALKMVAEKMPLVILDGELLVGSKTMYAPGTLRAAPPGPHNLNPLCFPHYATPQEKERLGDQEGKSKNHALPAYQLALREGLDGMRQRLDARMARPGATKAQREFWRASRIVLDAVSALALRYAEKAREAAAREAGARRAELQEIARVCQLHARRKLCRKPCSYIFLFIIRCSSSRAAAWASAGSISCSIPLRKACARRNAMSWFNAFCSSSTTLPISIWAI